MASCCDRLMQDTSQVALMTASMAHLRQWEGRCETAAETVTEAPALSIAAMLNRDIDTVSGQGAALPPLWHWLYFLPKAKQCDLGEDGHPSLGGFLPPIPLPRRMWAGGRLQWHEPIRMGDELHRTTRIVSVSHKAGRSGDLVFVLLRHEFRKQGVLALTEEQDIVYRAPPRTNEPVIPPQSAPRDAVWARELHPDPVLLFRYSALTFNGHRIHYDRPYATQVEGYPGLVVHGPLLATLLIDLAQSERPHAIVSSFTFKAVRPTCDIHPFKVCGRPATDGGGAQLWAQDHEGWLTMQAEIRFA